MARALPLLFRNRTLLGGAGATAQAVKTGRMPRGRTGATAAAGRQSPPAASSRDREAATARGVHATCESRISWRRRLATALAAVALSLAPMLAPAIPAAADDATAASGQCRPGITNYVKDTPWIDPLLGLNAMRSVSQGDGVTVAVVDSGVSRMNPHLTDAVDDGVNMAGDSASDGTTDDYGHGTAVAGIIASRDVNGSALRGVAPKARILPVRVFSSIDESSGAGSPSLDALAKGILYAANHGAQIINVSMSNLTNGPQLEDAVRQASAKGSLVVASAGNRATSSSTQDGPRWPAALDQVLGVAASDADGHVSADSIHGSQVDVLAPGMDVLTAVPRGVDCVYATDKASSSFATAYASGVAALVAAAHPDESPAQWKLRIEASADRPNPDARDDGRGWGMVNPRGAVTMTLGDGLRGPDGGLVKPYVPYDGAPQTLRVRATEDVDGPTRRLIAMVGVVAAAVTVMLLALAKARELRAAPSVTTAPPQSAPPTAPPDRGSGKRETDAGAPPAGKGPGRRRRH